MGRLRLGTVALAAALLAFIGPAGRAVADDLVGGQTSQTMTSLDMNTRHIQLSALQEAEVQGSASADSSLYEGLEGNGVFEQDGESTAHLGDTFAGAVGIVSINQSPGSNNNQGNIVSFACVDADGAAALLAHGSGEVINRDNVVDAASLTRTNVIDSGAFENFTGALQLNQSAGNVNNQNNIVAIASGNNGVVSLADGVLGQQVARNTVTEMAVMKRDIISGGAFANAHGLISINQSSGCGNNQTNLVVISVQQFL